MAEKTKEKKETTATTARKRGRQKGCVKTGGRKKEHLTRLHPYLRLLSHNCLAITTKAD